MSEKVLDEDIEWLPRGAWTEIERYSVLAGDILEISFKDSPWSAYFVEVIYENKDQRERRLNNHIEGRVSVLALRVKAHDAIKLRLVGRIRTLVP